MIAMCGNKLYKWPLAGKRKEITLDEVYNKWVNEHDIKNSMECISFCTYCDYLKRQGYVII